jgi:hypothetical protein
MMLYLLRQIFGRALTQDFRGSKKTVKNFPKIKSEKNLLNMTMFVKEKKEIIYIKRDNLAAT